MRTSKPRQQSGFSLLEILIAFSILSLSIGILLNIFSGGVNTAMTAEDYTAAVQIAESLIAKTGNEIKLKDHQSSGTENDKYRWSLDIRPFTISNEDFDAKNAKAEVYQINATVTWDEDSEGGGRELQLVTLKLGSKNNGLQQQ